MVVPLRAPVALEPLSVEPAPDMPDDVEPDDGEEPAAPVDPPDDPEVWANATALTASAPMTPRTNAFMQISRLCGGRRTADVGVVFQPIEFFKA